MRAFPRPLTLSLPALALAACVTTVPAPPPAVVVAPQPQRVIVAAPSQPVVVAPAYSGSSVAAPAAAIRLSAPEVQSLLANNTAVGVSASGIPYDVYFAGNGIARFRDRNVSDSGTWSVRADGALCSTLPRIAQGVEHCYSVIRDGDVILYQRPDGVAEGSIRIISGDPLGL